MDKFDIIFDKASSLGCKIKRDVPMNKYTTFKIGGNARLFCEVENKTQLSTLITACAENDTIRNLPFPVDPEKVYNAMLAADQYGKIALGRC